MFATLLWLFRGAFFLLGAVSAQGAFPRPLSAAEEADCLCRAAEGDETARQKLIVHNLRLVSHIAHKYAVPGYTQEDLVSVGTLGLIKAVNTFRPETGVRLTTYAARCIENEILMLLRASRKVRNEVSLSEPLGTDGEGNDISFMDILGTPDGQVEEDVIRRVSMAQVRRQITALPRRERLVMEMRYGLMDGKMYAQHEVAGVLGVSRSYVSRLESRAIRLIRTGMGLS